MQRITRHFLMLAALLLVAAGAQAQIQETYFLSDEPAAIGPAGAFQMLPESEGIAPSISIPLLEPVGVTSDTWVWLSDATTLLDRESVGSATVVLDDFIDVDAATVAHVGLFAYADDGTMLQLGAGNYEHGAEEVLPDTITIHVDVDGGVIPAGSYLLLQLEVQGTGVASIKDGDAADALFSESGSWLQGFQSRILDSDGDGLADTIERILGTNVYVMDTDFDGYSDGHEIQQGTDPLDPDSYPGPGGGAGGQYPDSDGDALIDILEIQFGTDVNNPDTDGDGWNDGAEVYYGSDPLDPESVPFDWDFDGIPDVIDPCPRDPDCNDDGVPDGEEDDDGDGTNNEDESKEGPGSQNQEKATEQTNLKVLAASGAAGTGLILSAIGVRRFL